MTKHFEGKVALVTGAASGIGRASSLAFAREGAKTVVADVLVEGGEETVRIIREAGGDSLFVRTDVSKERISTGLSDNPHGFLTAFDKDVGNDSFRPFSGKRQGACPAYSRSGTRHQSHFAFEMLGHFALPGKVRLTPAARAPG